MYKSKQCLRKYWDVQTYIGAYVHQPCTSAYAPKSTCIRIHIKLFKWSCIHTYVWNNKPMDCPLKIRPAFQIQTYNKMLNYHNFPKYISIFMWFNLFLHVLEDLQQLIFFKSFLCLKIFLTFCKVGNLPSHQLLWFLTNI